MLIIPTTVMGRCPPHIETLIELANLPGRQDPPDLGELFVAEHGDQDMWTAAEQAIAGEPRAFREYVGPVRFETRQTFVTRWDNVSRARRTLAAIIATSIGPVDVFEIARRMAELRRDTNGKLEVTVAEDVQALVGLPASRVARCRRCEKFLWMSRLRRQPLCSDACRQANWRARNPETYRRIQIENERRRALREARGTRPDRPRAKSRR